MPSSYLPPPPELRDSKKTYNFSTSRLGTYNYCPYKFYLHYILKLKPLSEMRAANVGKLVHKVCEDFYGEIAIPTDTPLKDFEHVLFELYQKHSTRYTDFMEDKDLDKVYTCLKNFADAEAIRYKEYEDTGMLSKFKPEMIEGRLFGDICGYKFIGIIDRVHYIEDATGKIYDLIPIDYKTGAVRKYSLQSNVYAILLKQNIGVFPSAFYFDYLAKGKRKKELIDQASQKEMERVIKETITKIENKEYPRLKEKFKCRMCDYGAECSAREYREQGLIDF